MNFYKVELEFNAEEDGALDSIDDLIVEQLMFHGIDKYDAKITIQRVSEDKVLR